MKVIFGNYRLDKELAAGGMGKVHSGMQLSLQRPVAIKELSKTLSENPHFIARFEKEAIGLGTMTNENIVGALDFGKADNSYFIVMEFVNGMDLASFIRSKFILEGNEALTIFEGCARGLAYAHKKSILHRDIKPANIMINTDGVVKVADFGLCRFVDDPTELTMTGAVMGTPRYMSPEQARGLFLDKTSDIYSLGLVLYEMLTGLVAIKGSSPRELIEAQIKGSGPDMSKIPRKVHKTIVNILKKCTAQKIEDRYQTFSEILTEIRHLRRKRSEFHDHVDLAEMLEDEGIHSTIQPDILKRVEKVRASIETRIADVDGETLDLHSIPLSQLNKCNYIQKYYDFYLKPSCFNESLEKSLMGKSILIQGRPGSGKTRLLFEIAEALRENLPDYKVVIFEPHKENEPLKKGKVLVIWDDIDRYIASWNPQEYIAELRRNLDEVLVIGSIRSGTQLSLIEEQKPEWLYLFDNRIRLTDIVDSQAIELAKATRSNTNLFDGTPGSIVLDLTAVKAIYKNLGSPHREILHTMKLFSILDVKRLKRNTIALITENIFDENIDKAKLREALKELCADSLLKRLGTKYSFYHDVYSIKVVTDFEEFDLVDELDELVEILKEAEEDDILLYITSYYWHIQNFDAMYELSKYNYMKLPNTVQTILYMALAKGNQYKTDEAIELINKAIDIQPSNSELYNCRGVNYRRQDKLDKALEDYNFALSLKPNCPVTLNNRANAFRLMGKREKALADYNSALVANPDKSKLYNNRSVEKFASGDVNGAIEDLKQSIKLNPHNARPHTNLGIMQRYLGNDIEARQNFEIAVKINPLDAYAHYNHAHVMKNIPDYQRALEDYAHSFELFKDIPSKARTLAACAIIYAIIGQNKKVFDILEAADKLDRDAALYNKLCALSELSKKDKSILPKAFEVLREVLQANKIGKEWLVKDKDIAILREDKKFQELLDQF